MSDREVYAQYWYRKELLAAGVPRFPVRRYAPAPGLSDIERVYFQAIRSAGALLDVGAGDLRVKKKLEAAGYRGVYDTQDVGTEYSHTYRSVEEVRRRYDAVLCLDVIEHLPLADGLALIDRLVALLEDGGVLVVQTPNARCIRHPLSWDMTHLQCYNIGDLWAYLTSQGLAVDGYRVVFEEPRRRLVTLTRSLLARYVIARLLGCDYADNIALIARKPATPTRRA